MVARRQGVPDRGDVVWVRFDPQAGHEQAGTRPAIVLSLRSYNQKAGLALVCPLTTQIKGYPFEVLVRGSSRVRGAILADQVRSIDWRARGAKFFGRVPDDVLAEVIERIQALLSAPTAGST